MTSAAAEDTAESSCCEWAPANGVAFIPVITPALSANLIASAVKVVKLFLRGIMKRGER